MLDHLMLQWEPYSDLQTPPPRPISLWSDGGVTIGIEDSWGPAVPYPPADHGDGHMNHGYVPLKDNVNGAARIPEAIGWPELEQLLRAANANDSPIESVGCEKAFFPVTGHAEISVKLGSYIDLVFSDPTLNDHPQNILWLATRLAPAVEGCQRWWSEVELCLQRFRGIQGATAPWGMLIRVTGYGRDERQARELWRVSLQRIAGAITTLSSQIVPRP